MFKNYLQSALRNLKRNIVFTSINLFGLSIALAASFIIILFVINELSFDHCHKNKESVYRVVNYYENFNSTWVGTSYVLASTMKEEFPQVEFASNVRRIKHFSISHKEEQIKVKNAIASNSDIFKIFTLPIISGTNTENLLKDKQSICLSRKLAMKMFSKVNVVGREIITKINKKEQILVVSAVFEDIPKNSTFKADCFINSIYPIQNLNKSFGVDNTDASWDKDFWVTWVKLIPNTTPKIIDDQFTTLEQKYIGAESMRHFSLQNLADVYLGSNEIMNTGIRGNTNTIKIFIGIALLIMLVAIINYVILSTSVSSGRAKEIGVRKTFGAGNSQIKHQFLTESVLLTIIVLPLAIALMIIGKSYAEVLFQTQLPIIAANIPNYVLFYFGLTIILGLVSGLYTSVGLSKLNVLEVLKAKNMIGKKKNFIRSSLIIFQLIIFCFFVSSAITIRSQYQYSLNKNPGFHNKNVLLVNIENGKYYLPLLNEARSNPNVISAAGAMHGLPMRGSMVMMFTHSQDKDKSVKTEGMAVDFNFLQTMGVSLKKGRYFSTDHGSDRKNARILNETAVKALGFKDPIGKLIEGSEIIGVVKDFHLHSFHTDIPPLSIRITEKYLHQIAIHYQEGSEKALISKLEKSWSKLAPEQPFSYSTVEGIIETLYSEEKNKFKIVRISAFFTMLIAAFGLFGLTLFVSKSRTKEIGIKKVLGCSDSKIVISFLKTNIAYVFVASVISIPITYYAMEKWLSDYAVKTEIKWWFFAVTFIIASLVVIATVLFHSYKAARLNPVESLKYE